MAEMIFDELGLKGPYHGASIGDWLDCRKGERVPSTSPIDGATLGEVYLAGPTHYEQVLTAAKEGFRSWREVPAPQRGEVIRQLGEAFRTHKEGLGRLITLEMGKKPERRRRRSTGDDRHLRLRRRPESPTLWPQHAQRAPAAPHDRAVAAAGPNWRHYRVQLSDGRLVLERGHRSYLWQHGYLEARTANPSMRPCGSSDLQSCHGRQRRTGGSLIS